LRILLIVALVARGGARLDGRSPGDPTARMLGRITLNPLAHIDWIGTVLFPLIAIMTGVPLLGWAKPCP
jgi:Zn-dependent protease